MKLAKNQLAAKIIGDFNSEIIVLQPLEHEEWRGKKR